MIEHMNELASDPMEPILLCLMNTLKAEVISGVITLISDMETAHDLLSEKLSLGKACIQI